MVTDQEIADAVISSNGERRLTGAVFFGADELRTFVGKIECAVKKKIFTNGDRSMTMEGRSFTVGENGFISDQNFDFDAGLKVSGDFVNDEKQQYAQMIADVLNDHNK